MGRVWCYIPAVSDSGSQVQSHPGLQSELEAALGYKFEASLDYLARWSQAT